MNKPKLVIMAAGMGSRFGGLKQITPFDDYGNMIIDFSIYDALRAGFEDIVFIIKHEIEEDFKNAIGKRIEARANVTYVYQQLDNLPAGFTVPEGRVKPWGTSHAVLCCKNVIDGAFVPLNADDYYGPEAFKIAYDFLMSNTNENEHCLVGYPVAKTLTANGHVSRGVCEVTSDGFLSDIHERTKVKMVGDDGAAYTEDDGATYIDISKNATVSMNIWGFNIGMMHELEKSFPEFLARTMPTNPLKCEDYLPEAVRRAVENNRLSVKVIPTNDRWHGVTYSEDRFALVEAIKQFKAAGLYSEKLWD